MATDSKKKPSGYDKYVDWKMFSVPLVLLFVLLLIPTPYGMKDVGTEYSVGPKAGIGLISQTLFQKASQDAEQWQLVVAGIMEKSMNMGAFSRERYLSRSLKWAVENKVYMAVANRTGTEKRGDETLTFTGKSAIYDFTGKELSTAGSQENKVIQAEINPSQTRDKSFNPINDILGDRQPQFYSRLTEKN